MEIYIAPCKVGPEVFVFPRFVQRTELITLLRRWFDELDVEPLHEVFTNRSVFISEFWLEKDDEEREARVQTPVVVAAELEGSFWSRYGLLEHNSELRMNETRRILRTDACIQHSLMKFT